MGKFIFVLVLLVSFGSDVCLLAEQQDPNSKEDLFEMSIEELMEVQVVVSAARKEQKIEELSVPVSVITAEDIHYTALLKAFLSRVGRMHNLIDGILQYSRVGRVKEEKAQVNLKELVPDIVDTLAPPENITITIENELPVIKCGKTRITQVFQNLLSNAIKYMDKPQGHIKVSCVEEGNFWRFGITDNGPGIEEKYFERIFLIFQTLRPRDEFESTGVGLTVVKKIVEIHGGRIWVESKFGGGSTFFFTLPKQHVPVVDEKLSACANT